MVNQRGQLKAAVVDRTHDKERALVKSGLKWKDVTFENQLRFFLKPRSMKKCSRMTKRPGEDWKMSGTTRHTKGSVFHQTDTQ